MIRGAGETMVWLPHLRALIPGDRLLGDDAGGVRLARDSWLRYLPSGMRRQELRAALRPLLDLPIELVLVSTASPCSRTAAGDRSALAWGTSSAGKPKRGKSSG